MSGNGFSIPLLRLAAQTALLEAEALGELGGAGAALAPRVAVAVDADSMAPCFTTVLGDVSEVLFDIRIEDQDHSARLLREGVVMGAVTIERSPVARMPGAVPRGDAVPARGERGVRRAVSARRFHGGRRGTRAVVGLES